MTLHTISPPSQPTRSTIPMFPDGKGSPQTSRPLDPRSSVEDYSRVMLEYTQRRMSTFTDMDDQRHNSTGSNSSGSSTSSDKSGASTSGVLARQAAAPTTATTSESPPSDQDAEPAHRNSESAVAV